MSKTFFFLKDIDTSQMAENHRDAYCPTGGYFDKNQRRFFESKRQKRTYLAAHGMRECGELYNPDKSIGGTEGRMKKTSGSRGNFASRPMPAWMRKELAHVG